MTNGPSDLERGDIQGLVIRGYRMPQAAYLFYRFTDPAPAHAWLGAMIDPVTTAAEWDATPPWCANVALSYTGLEALEVPVESLASFPDDFRQGMAARAVTHLGDVGDDLPDHWEPRPPFASREVHALVLVSARDCSELDRQVSRFSTLATTIGGLELVGDQHAAVIAAGEHADREHFGFRDGISQPTLKGSGLDTDAHAERLAVEPGEFVLGYVDEAGLVAPMPEPQQLGRNGTFVVYRKMHQHVASFRSFLGAQGGGNEELLAAKLVGRWRSGAPLATAPEADDVDLAADRFRNNDFHYTDDPLGYACPRGAHIRRARPRDDSQVNRRRLLIRRGLTYGEPLPAGAPDDGIERGLVGLMVNASIERQFEFVQRRWLNWGQFDGLANDPDPITGPGEGDFTWQRRPVPKRYGGLPRFVTVRGGEYFFMPSITAMHHLADLS